MPLSVAEQAFSLAVTPLPGVTIPAGKHDDTLFSATAPIRWLSAHRNELTAAQHRVADPWLDQRPGTLVVPAAMSGRPKVQLISLAAGSASTDAARRAETDQQRYEAVVAKLLAKLALHFGKLGYDVPVVLQPKAGGTAYTLAAGGNSECTLSVFPKAHAASGNDLDFLVAHELVHCFQYRDAVDAVVNGGDAVSWVKEGGADWAALEVSGPTQLMTNHWNQYLGHPETALFGRSYDAVGFFAHLKETGADPWRVLIPMFNAADNPGRYTFAVGSNPAAFEDTWASGFFRGQPVAGTAWKTSGIGMTSTRPEPRQAKVGEVIDTPAWTLTTAELTSSADVTSVSAAGSVRVGSGTKVDQVVAPGTTLDLCTRQGGCTCPPGSIGEPPPLEAKSPIAIAVTSLTGVAEARTKSTKLEEYCKRPKPTPPPAPAAGACRLLTVAEINHITGLHVNAGVDHGDNCVFIDPAQPAASPNLAMAGAIVPKILTDGPAVATRAGLVVLTDPTDSGGANTGGGGDASSGQVPPGCTVSPPDAATSAFSMICPTQGFGFAGAGARSGGTVGVMYFPSPSGVAGLATATPSLLSTAVPRS